MKMERKRSKHASVLLWATVAALLTQNLVTPVMSSAAFEDQKNYYSPDPGSRSPPLHGSGGGHGTPTPSHGPPSHGSGGGYGTPKPSHGTPSHGGGSYGGTPPSGNCGNPPSGGHHHTAPTPPTGGGGGYYNPPSSSTPTIVSPPSILSPPTTPIIPGTPTTPIDPGTPSIPSPPYAFDPNSPPFTCDYWRTHPGLIWGLFGWWGTVVGAFGVARVPGLGSSTNLLQALSNTRPDGLGALYREGTAALLNSMMHRGFPYTTRQVRDSFGAALSSNKAAAAQAKLFKQANEGRTKPRA
ncbi:Hypothetical predicted protein [Olea europaea subsp. europaea]|uniref:Protodermal factor 1 n=1 Tax=Olea europaea subsp. europaea TaxID=158383 RepID=A0A8S0PMP3_OLEEU|nr:Hypothetical predicted protein [Olea europaea subsp. europaea]